ncbi:uncharacterized protein [Miscanthus floridulus]|uniref:uncharacterized protein n=1 Tax=Miscanthus floridulus TaxID=154761 RepID=UPI00345A855B
MSRPPTARVARPPGTTARPLPSLLPPFLPRISLPLSAFPPFLSLPLSLRFSPPQARGFLPSAPITWSLASIPTTTAALGPSPDLPSAGSGGPLPVLGWDAVWALEDQQRCRLHRIWERGVAWKPSSPGSEGAAPAPVVFRLDHGGEVDADGNCLFTAERTVDARELGHRAMRRFAKVYTAAGEDDKASIDAAVRHLYAPPSRSSLILAFKARWLAARKTKTEETGSLWGRCWRRRVLGS